MGVRIVEGVGAPGARLRWQLRRGALQEKTDCQQSGGVCARVFPHGAPGSFGGKKPCDCTALERLGTASNGLDRVFWGLYIISVCLRTATIMRTGGFNNMGRKEHLANREGRRTCPMHRTGLRRGYQKLSASSPRTPHYTTLFLEEMVLAGSQPETRAPSCCKQTKKGTRVI
jgi:hypothetical protein